MLNIALGSLILGANIVDVYSNIMLENNKENNIFDINSIFDLLDNEIMENMTVKKYNEIINYKTNFPYKEILIKRLQDNAVLRKNNINKCNEIEALTKYNHDLEMVKEIMNNNYYKYTPKVILAMKIYLLDYNIGVKGFLWTKSEVYSITSEQFKIMAIVWFGCKNVVQIKDFYVEYVYERILGYMPLSVEYIKYIIPILKQEVMKKIPLNILEQIEKEKSNPKNAIYYRSTDFTKKYKTYNPYINFIIEYNIYNSIVL